MARAIPTLDKVLAPTQAEFEQLFALGAERGRTYAVKLHAKTIDVIVFDLKTKENFVLSLPGFVRAQPVLTLHDFFAAEMQQAVQADEVA